MRIFEIFKRLFGRAAFWALVFLAVIAGVMWASSLVAHADYTITTVSGEDAQVTLSGSRRFAQQFTTVGAGTIEEVFACYQNDPTTFDAAIYSDVANNPDTELATMTFAGGSSGMLSATLDTPLVIDEEQEYWYVTFGDDSSPQPCGDSSNSLLSYFDQTGSYANTDGIHNISIEVLEGGEEPPPEAATTTESVSTASQEAYNGFVLFFMAMFLTIFIFKKR